MECITLSIGSSVKLNVSGVECLLTISPVKSRPSGRSPVPVDTEANSKAFTEATIRYFSEYRKSSESDSSAVSTTLSWMKNHGFPNASWSACVSVLRSAGMFRSNRGMI